MAVFVPGETNPHLRISGRKANCTEQPGKEICCSVTAPACTATDVRTVLPTPTRSTVSVYCPGGRSTAPNHPCPSVCSVRDCWRAQGLSGSRGNRPGSGKPRAGPACPSNDLCRVRLSRGGLAPWQAERTADRQYCSQTPGAMRRHCWGWHSCTRRRPEPGGRGRRVGGPAATGLCCRPDD